MRFAGWLLFLLALAPLNLNGFAQPRQDAAQKLLDGLVRRYNAARTVVASGIFVNTSKSPQSETSVRAHFTLHARHPHFIRFVVEMTTPKGVKQRQTIVSDGHNVFEEYPQLKQVLKRPLEKGKVPLQTLIGDIFKIDEWLKRLKSPKVVGEETVRGRRTKIIQASTEDETSVRLWVADNIIWQGQVTVEGERLASRMGNDPQKPNPFAEAMKQTTFVITVQFERINFNVPIPDAVFSYKPPTGFKVVEKLELPSPIPPAPSP